MKKDQIKCGYNDMKGKMDKVPSNLVGVPEPRHEGDMQNVHGMMAAAYADLKNAYKKPG